MIHKTLHRKLTFKQPKPGMSSDAPDKLAVPALLVIPVVVKIIIQIQVCFSLHNNLHLFIMLNGMFDSSGILPDEACAPDQCVTNAVCTDSKCACNTGYIATPTSTPTSCESEYTYMKELDAINALNLT